MPFAVSNYTIGAAGTLEDSFVIPTASRPNEFTPLNPSVVNVVNVAIAPPAPTTSTLATTIEYAQGIVSESIAEYGIQETPVVITLLATLEDAALLAEYLVRPTPAFWFGNIQIMMNGLTDTQRTLVGGLDIGAQISVTKTFPNSTPATVTQVMSLEGISHDITPDRHIVTLYTNPSRIYTYFTIGGYTTTTTRTNLVTNPNFETNTTGWANFAGTNARTTSTSYSGIACLQTDASASGSRGMYTDVPVTAGISYTASMYVKAASGTMSHWVYMRWLNSGGGIISNTTVSSTATTTWQRFSQTQTAPVGAATLRLMSLSSAASATNWYTDAVMVEASSTLLPYFDGTYADTYTGYTLTEQAWNGTANASTSTATWGLTSSFVGSELNDDTKGLG